MIDISFDLDETLVTIIPMVTEIIFDETGIEFINPTRFNCWSDFGISKEIMFGCFQLLYDRWMEVPLVEGAEELLRKLWEQGKEPINIITARDINYTTQTYKLLERFNVPFALSMVENKVPYVTKKYYVDDRRETAKILSSLGKQVYMPNQTYNRGCENNGFIYEIDSVKDLLPLISTFIK